MTNFFKKKILKRKNWKEINEIPDWISNKFIPRIGHGWTDNMHYEQFLYGNEKHFKGKHYEYLIGLGEIWRKKKEKYGEKQKEIKIGYPL